MTDLPFQLSIKNSLSGGQAESLTCIELLRVIAGRREVYRALWNENPVIVKLFSHKICAGRHHKREWRGLSLLRKQQLNCPEPLFFGQTEDGRWAVVTEMIESLTALEVYNEAADTAGKLRVLVLICREMAAQHRKGGWQGDLHLGNFLVKGEKIYAIDPAGLRFCRGEVGREGDLSDSFIGVWFAGRRNEIYRCIVPGVCLWSRLVLF